MAESAYPKRPVRIFSMLLIVTAALLYWVWAVSYGSWNIFAAENMGIYTLFIVMLAFGVLGLLLTRFRQ